ncbi:MAG: secretin and TonB N-terminal domain-containing protein [Gammaproteobacteria bacterium]
MKPFNRLVAIVCFAVIATAAPGEEAAIHLNIPPQPAAAALDALAAQSGLQPFYTDASVQGLNSPGVMGRYTLHEAVEKLLAGTGLSYQFTGAKSVAIKKPERVAENDAADNAPKKPEAPPAKPEEEVELPEITVTASPLDATSYNVFNATTATKTDTPIMETPFSIQVVSQQVLKDQQTFRLEQALRNVSGVYTQPMGIWTGAGETFLLRGFGSENSLLRRICGY